MGKQEITMQDAAGLLLDIACGTLPVNDGVRCYLLEWAREGSAKYPEWAAGMKMLAASTPEVIRCFFGGKCLAMSGNDFYSNDLVAATGLSASVVEAACLELVRIKVTRMGGLN